MSARPLWNTSKLLGSLELPSGLRILLVIQDCGTSKTSTRQQGVEQGNLSKVAPRPVLYGFQHLVSCYKCEGARDRHVTSQYLSDLVVSNVNRSIRVPRWVAPVFLRSGGTAQLYSCAPCGWENSLVNDKHLLREALRQLTKPVPELHLQPRGRYPSPAFLFEPNTCDQLLPCEEYSGRRHIPGCRPTTERSHRHSLLRGKGPISVDGAG